MSNEKETKVSALDAKAKALANEEDEDTKIAKLLKNMPKWRFYSLAVLTVIWTVFQLYIKLVKPLDPWFQLPLHMCLALVVVWLYNPMVEKSKSHNKLWWIYDIFLIASSCFICWFFLSHAEQLNYRIYNVDVMTTTEIIVAVLLLKTGYEGGKETLGQLLGQRPSTELAEKVRQIVLSYPEILAIHDLVIHDYGPGRCHVSLHAEVDGEENIYELHEAIDRAMSELDHKLGCFSVIHMDPVDTKNERLAELREETVQLLREIDPVLSLHDFRMVPGNHRTNLVFDVLVPFGYKLSDEDVRKAIRKAVEERHPDCRCVIQVDKSYT